MHFSNRVMWFENVLYGKEEHTSTQHPGQVTPVSTSHWNFQLSVSFSMNSGLPPFQTGLLEKQRQAPFGERWYLKD